MTAVSIPVIAIFGITLYVGGYHLFLFYRRGGRSDLAFALMCGSLALYDVFCVGLYESTSLAEGAGWQRAQLAVLAFGLAPTLWFFYEYTQLASARIVWALSLAGAVAGGFQLFDRSALTWVASEPSIKEVQLPFGSAVTYHELSPGPVTIGLEILGPAALVYVVWLGVRLIRRGARRRGRSLVIAMALFAPAAINDALVGLGVYVGVYLLEYSYAGVIVLMAYSLSDELVEAAATRDALQKSETHLDITLDSIGDAVIATDRSGAIVRMNRMAERLTGWSATDALGRELDTVLRLAIAGDVEPEDVYAVSPVELVLATGDVVELREETVLITREGERRRIADSAAPIRDQRGEIIGVVVAFRDVTEQRLLSEQLRRAQRMESLGRLAGGVAHDFNNLLTPILAYADLGRTDERHDDRTREIFSQIERAASRAAELTRQLLAFGRKQVLEVRALQLNEELELMRPILKRLIRENIEIEMRLDPELGAVRADPSQIQQILMNLVINARDAQPAGGRVVIETENVELASAEVRADPVIGPGSYVRLSVSDEGVGMDAHTMAHLFEPFYTTKERGHGTGLGLATVQGIVVQHGGGIRVKSELGRGSTFTVYLPRLAAGEVPAPEPDTEAARPRETVGFETVLVVEDDPMVRQLTSRILSETGYEVLTAEGGEEALRVADTHPGPLHLLLTDVVMAGMSGRALAREIRARRPDTAVVLMSGYADEETLDVHDGLRLLSKPFGLAELRRTVRAALDARGGDGPIGQEAIAGRAGREGGSGDGARGAGAAGDRARGDGASREGASREGASGEGASRAGERADEATGDAGGLVGPRRHRRGGERRPRQP